MRIADWKKNPKSKTQHPKLCWLSLDDNDNDPTRFITYLIAALQTITPDVGETAVSLLHAPQPPPIEAIMTSLINEIAELDAQRHILVLDDYHLVTNTAVHQTLTFLLENIPAQLHLVILTRADPVTTIPGMTAVYIFFAGLQGAVCPRHRGAWCIHLASECHCRTMGVVPRSYNAVGLKATLIPQTIRH